MAYVFSNYGKAIGHGARTDAPDGAAAAATEAAAEIADRQNRSLLRVLPVLLLVALLMTGGGLTFAAFQVDLLLHGETAAGEVVALEAGTVHVNGHAALPALQQAVRDAGFTPR